MAVAVINLSIEQGTDFSLSLTLKANGAPIDLTGYTYSANLKKYFTSKTSYPFTVTPKTPLTSGVVSIGMSEGLTATIPAGRYVYDVLITDDGVGSSAITSKYFKGTVIVEGSALNGN